MLTFGGVHRRGRYSCNRAEGVHIGGRYFTQQNRHLKVYIEEGDNSCKRVDRHRDNTTINSKDVKFENKYKKKLYQ